MPTSLVTGGAGFLGSHLCEALLARGHRVICLDNLETGSLANIEHLRDDAFAFVPQDLTRHVEIAERIDFLYHLASPASPIDYLRLPLQTLKVGSHGTHNALQARQGPSLAVPARVDERGLRRPAGPPAAGDVLGSRESDRAARGIRRGEALRRGADDGLPPAAGVDTAIVRIFNTYGPRMRPHDGRAIPTFIRQALEEKPLTVFGDGSQTGSFCFVDDLVRGLILLAESGEHMP